MPTGSVRTLLLACLCCGGWAFGFGLECPLASLWQQDAGATETGIGINTAMHFVGVLLAGAFVPSIMSRTGRGGIALGLLVSGVAVALFPFGNGPVGWGVLRVLAGAGGALAMITLETVINWNAPPRHRARHFAYYACAVGIGFAAGSFVGMQVYAVDPYAGFLVGGLMTIVAVPVVRWLPPFPMLPYDEGVSIPLRPPFLSMASAGSQGFLEIGLLALLPLYLRYVGVGDADSGSMIGGILIGVLLVQVPIGTLADHCGRERVLVVCFVLTCIGLFFAPQSSSPTERFGWLLLVGVCSGSLYPLGLALLGERLPASALPRANALYLGVNCFGSMVSPLVTGPAMRIWGPPAMFWSGQAVIVGVLVIWLIIRASNFSKEPRTL